MKKLLLKLSLIGLTFLFCSCSALFDDFYTPIAGELSHGTYCDTLNPASTVSDDSSVCVSFLVVESGNKIHYYEELIQFYEKESKNVYVELAEPKVVRQNDYTGTYQLAKKSRCIFSLDVPNAKDYGSGPLGNKVPWYYSIEYYGLKFYTKGSVLSPGSVKKFYHYK